MKKNPTNGTVRRIYKGKQCGGVSYSTGKLGKAVLAAHSDLEVIFCCFSAGDKAVYESLLNLS